MTAALSIRPAPLASETASTVARLKGKAHAVLGKAIPSAERFALLDFPDHDNIGDSAIWVGEIAYLDHRRMRPSYVSSNGVFNRQRMETRIGTGPILLHGGGNFGDIWGWFQAFRERVLAEFPGRPVVQLPQSIHYEDPANADRTARAIEKHGAFTLLVRDTQSLEFARARFPCETILCPDMAFCIGSLSRPERPVHDLLLHLRTDKEAGKGRGAGATLPQGPGVLQADWPGEAQTYRRDMRFASVIDALRRGRLGGRAVMTEHAYRFRAQDRFNRGAALLGSAKRVLTDRLHGHIMSLLLGIPHVVLDNSYGKNSRFINTWNTCESPDVRLATDMADALAHLRQPAATGAGS